MNFLKSDGYEPFVDLPVTKPVLLYFSQLYGSKEIHIDGYHVFSPLMKLAIDKVPYKRMTIRRRKPFGALRIVFPVRYRLGHIREETTYIMAEYLERIMERDMFAFVSGAVNTGSSEQAAVKTFIDIFELDQDVDTLRMRCRRNTEFKSIQKKSCQCRSLN